MQIGVPKEIKNHEYRVGLTPSSVQELVADGHKVWVESYAGKGVGFSNEDYRAAGATLVPDAPSVPIEQQFSTGQRVSHSSFGSGLVIESKQIGSDELVIVAFDGVGIKRLVAGSANLQIEAE